MDERAAGGGAADLAAPGSGVRVEEFKERLRRKLPEAIPGTALSFEAGDVVSQVMNFGAPTPIEIAVSGPNLAANRASPTR